MKKKIKIEPDKLRDFLTIAMGVVPKKSLIPILDNIIISVTKESLVIRAGTIADQITITVEGYYDEEFTICVPAQTFCSTIISIYAATVTLEYDEKKLTIIHGKSKYSMPTYNASEYPVIRIIEGGHKVSIDGQAIHRAIQNAASLVNPSDLRTSISGINLSLSNGSLSVMGSDGISAIMQKVKTNDLLFPDSLTSKSLADVTSLMKFKGDATIESNGKNVEIICNNFKVNSRTIEAAYPPLQKLMDLRNPGFFIVGKAEIMEALRRLKLFTSAEIPRVMFIVAEGQITLQSDNVNHGKDAIEVIETDTTSVPPMKIRFNINSINNIVSRIECDKIKVHFTKENERGYFLPESEEVSGEWAIAPTSD
jgi:DNA polymerase-3 subunit beta